MGKKNGMSRDQKRKAKLKKRNDRRGPEAPLPYSGSKYRTPELVPLFIETELAVLNAYKMTNRELIDADVENAYLNLIEDLRAGEPIAIETADDGGLLLSEEMSELVIDLIQANWVAYFAEHRNPGRDKLAGILRTLLGSIDSWRLPTANSQGYIRYVESFLKKAGYSVDAYSETGTLLPSPPEHELTAIGNSWIAGDDDAEKDFRDRARRMTENGEGEQVALICQELIGSLRGRDHRLSPVLSQISVECQRGMLAVGNGSLESADAASAPAGQTWLSKLIPFNRNK